MKNLSNPSIDKINSTDKKASSNYQPSPSDQQRVRMVEDRWQTAYNNQYPYFSDFDRYYKMYESYVNDTKSIWQTKIFIPIVFSVIERFLPRLISNKPTVNFMGRQEDTVKKAQKMQSLFEYQWDQVSRVRDGGMYMELLRFVKDALVVGTAFAKIPWRLEGQDTKYYNDKQEVATKYVKYFDGPDFQLIDPYDFFFDPEAIDIQRASWVIHRTRRTLDEMKEINKAKGVEIYKNLHILETMPPDTMAATENDFKLRRKISLGGSQLLIRDNTIDKYELKECWGLFPKLDANGKPSKSQELEPRVITTAGTVIVRDIPYPYWHGKKPFVSYTPFPRSYEMYGIPIIKHIERSQFYINEFMSQKFDNQVIELNQMLVVAPEANLEDWQLVWRPGGVIRANPEYVKPLALGDVTGGLDQSVQYLSSTIQNTTGLSDYYTAGANAPETQNKTATGANIIEEQIAIRIKQAMQVLEEQVIKEIGYQWHGLDGQFLKLPQVVRVVGPDGQPDFPLVDVTDIRQVYDVVPEAGSTQPTNEALQRQQFLQVLQVIQGNPVMAQATDWTSVELELWRRFGFKEGNKMMTTTAGSVPRQSPGGDALLGGQTGAPNVPGQPQVGPTANPGQFMAGMMGATAGFRSPPTAQQPPNQPSNPNKAFGPPETPPQPPPMTNIKPKFQDLTAREQEQVLKAMGIEPDMMSRFEKMSHQQQTDKMDRSMELMKNLVPPGGGLNIK